ncbi:MAG: deoxyribonuclease IV [Candidatus Eremiobacteraeota bacterium]|nr:deoxyribonuclease IV [Candidatus Eremiobacteraeota bacterium]
MRFGSHLPIGGGFAKTVADALAAHCQCIQIFAGNPRAWRIAPFDAPAWDSFRSARRRHGIAPTVIHTSYLVNLASANADLRRKSAALVAHDLSVAATAGIEYVNTHLGSYASSDCLAGLERVTRTVAALVRGAPRGPMLLLENSAGAGALCGAAIEELAVILDRVNSKRVGVCLDTAHLWAAGYDISDARGVASVLRLVERHIGLNRVMAWHLNDTQVELGSRRDLHWHIGRGRIGEAGFRALVRNRACAHACGICETPKPTERGFSNVGEVRRLAGDSQAAGRVKRNIGGKARYAHGT